MSGEYQRFREAVAAREKQADQLSAAKQAARDAEVRIPLKMATRRNVFLVVSDQDPNLASVCWDGSDSQCRSSIPVDILPALFAACVDCGLLSLGLPGGAP